MPGIPDLELQRSYTEIPKFACDPNGLFDRIGSDAGPNRYEWDRIAVGYQTGYRLPLNAAPQVPDGRVHRGFRKPIADTAGFHHVERITRMIEHVSDECGREQLVDHPLRRVGRFPAP